MLVCVFFSDLGQKFLLRVLLNTNLNIHEVPLWSIQKCCIRSFSHGNGEQWKRLCVAVEYHVMELAD